MKLTCIEELSLSTGVLLTAGKEYEVLGENNGRYVVTDDNGKECHANKERFAASDEQFIKAVNDTLAKGYSEHELAVILRLSVPTVQRWASGKNIPHPFMRAGVLRYLDKVEIKK